MITTQTLREDLKQIWKTAPLCTLAMDGSQPRKTGFEKELVYAKAVVRGKSVELLLKCIHMNDFGGSADDLNAALDAFMKEYGIDDLYAKRLVSIVSTEQV